MFIGRHAARGVFPAAPPVRIFARFDLNDFGAHIAKWRVARGPDQPIVKSTMRTLRNGFFDGCSGRYGDRFRTCDITRLRKSRQHIVGVFPKRGARPADNTGVAESFRNRWREPTKIRVFITRGTHAPENGRVRKIHAYPGLALTAHGALDLHETRKPPCVLNAVQAGFQFIRAVVAVFGGCETRVIGHSRQWFATFAPLQRREYRHAYPSIPVGKWFADRLA